MFNSHNLSKDSNGTASSSFFAIWLLLWGIINLLTLTRFPYAHSDEVWLAGLSTAIRETGSLRTTEPFFDLFPRQPHLFKTLYHLIQAPLLTLPGPMLFWARLPSLFAALGTLVVSRQLLIRQHGRGCVPLLAVVALSLHPQFLYAAHFARQESLLLLVLVTALLLYDRTLNTPYFWSVPLLIGLGALLHPNAFLLAVILGARLLLAVLKKRAHPRKLMIYGFVLLLIAVALAGGSLLLNPSFLSDYRAFGASLSVDAPPTARWANFLAYFVKLYNRITGTYWLPDIRFWFLATAGCIVPGVVMSIRTQRQRTPCPSSSTTASDVLAEGLGFLAGMLVIGRLNPTALLFALPFSLRLATLLVEWGWSQTQWIRKITLGLGLVLVIITSASGIQAVWPFLHPLPIPATSTMAIGDRHDSPWLQRLLGAPVYESYLDKIRASLPADAVVLGNLSAGFAFEGTPFHDIRNLAPVGAQTPDPAAYIAEHAINTVIWYEEYDYILRNPQWRILYEAEPDASDPEEALSTQAPFLSALKDYLTEQGTLTDQFQAPVYGTRIVRYMGEGDWTVSVFTLRQASIAETPLAP